MNQEHHNHGNKYTRTNTDRNGSHSSSNITMDKPLSSKEEWETVIEARDKQWWEAVARLKKYQDLKIKRTKENKYLTKEEKELVIATCIDNKMCFDEIMGRFE